MRVYVAGLYSRNEKGQPANLKEVFDNIQTGTRFCAELMNMGYDVYCPWLDYQVLWYIPKMPLEAFYRNSMAWLEVSEVICVISGEGLCGGVDDEIERAKELNIPIVRGMGELLKQFPLQRIPQEPQVFGPDGRGEQEA